MPAQAQFYVLSDLGSLIATSYSVPHGLSENADVVGYSYAGLGAHAFIWTAEGGMQDLGTLGGSTSYAYGINASRQVVGYGPQAGVDRAFLWSADGGFQLLGTLGGSTSYAREINDAGQVAGYSQIASGKYRAYRWSAAAGMQNLGVLGSASSNTAKAFGEALPRPGRPWCSTWAWSACRRSARP